MVNLSLLKREEMFLKKSRFFKISCDITTGYKEDKNIKTKILELSFKDDSFRGLKLKYLLKRDCISSLLGVLNKVCFLR